MTDIKERALDSPVLPARHALCQSHCQFAWPIAAAASACLPTDSLNKPPSGPGNRPQQQFAATARGILLSRPTRPTRLSKRVNWHSKLPTNDLPLLLGPKKMANFAIIISSIIKLCGALKSMLRKSFDSAAIMRDKQRVCVTHVFCNLNLSPASVRHFASFFSYFILLLASFLFRLIFCCANLIT